MDRTANTPYPLDPVPEVTEGSIISSADRPICSERLSQRPSLRYPMGKLIGARINEGAVIAYGHLDGKIATN